MIEEAPRGLDAALAEIRAAEAARVLGVLDSQSLPALAARWVDDGLVTPDVQALAAAADTPRTDRLRMLATIAAASGTTFADVAAARAAHIEGMISTIDPARFPSQAFHRSNGYTDELTAKARALLSRLIGRGRER